MTIRKFEEHTAAQAAIIYYDDGTLALRSYATIVATVDSASWLTVNGLYSRTTIKHISWFMRLLANQYHANSLNYQLAKQLYTDKARMNLCTGEIEFME